MGRTRSLTDEEIAELRAIADDLDFIDRVNRLAKIFRTVVEIPIPHPLDSEVVVEELIDDARRLLDGLRRADKAGHPLALTMKNHGLAGRDILRTAEQSIDELLTGLDVCRRMARPGLKKNRGRKKNDAEQYLADSISELLTEKGVSVSRYKDGALAKCINIIRAASGYGILTDPCKGIALWK